MQLHDLVSFCHSGPYVPYVRLTEPKAILLPSLLNSQYGFCTIFRYFCSIQCVFIKLLLWLLLEHIGHILCSFVCKL